LKAGTRGSNLALVQTKNIITHLSKITNDKVIFKKIKSTGDINKDSKLYQIDVKGIFTKELDKAVLDEEVDFAVHSFKDLPIELEENLEIIAIPFRESPREALVSNYSWTELSDGATIGTSSLRREAFINHHLKNVTIKPIRGNVDTRVNKVLNGSYDATIMAEAGLKRLGLEKNIRKVFSPEYYTPPAGQGALAIVTRKDNKYRNVLKKLNHFPSAQEVKAEKTVLEELGGGCQWPLGANVRADKDKLHLYAILLNTVGEILSKVSMSGTISEAEKLGRKAGKIIKEDYQ
jgi:hydroxymethylbilane synthase